MEEPPSGQEGWLPSRDTWRGQTVGCPTEAAVGVGSGPGEAGSEPDSLLGELCGGPAAPCPRPLEGFTSANYAGIVVCPSATQRPSWLLGGEAGTVTPSSEAGLGRGRVPTAGWALPCSQRCWVGGRIRAECALPTRAWCRRRPASGSGGVRRAQEGPGPACGAASPWPEVGYWEVPGGALGEELHLMLVSAGALSPWTWAPWER